MWYSIMLRISALIKLTTTDFNELTSELAVNLGGNAYMVTYNGVEVSEEKALKASVFLPPRFSSFTSCLRIVGQGGDDVGQLLVVQAGCQVSTCVTVSLFLSLPLLVVGCFGLKGVHHCALPSFQVVLVSWQGWMSVECLRHTDTLGETPERERQKASALGYLYGERPCRPCKV
ncbi:hypothetical protein G5714_017959 [Onychostoma macrolepis]|uniref:Uncharacterized protein n=1 Tax=Onychostoma macrolepis TaxID=369639 RepID=A0A7J6C2L8_9TELE|nr:hypothetical protein G5714_017959 [Onychostoma macrolepis]